MIDPGKDCQPELIEVLAHHRLHPIAVMLTHGHIDHMWSVTPVSGEYGVPAFVHPADRYRLTEPWGSGGMPSAIAAQLGSVGLKFVEPAQLRELGDGLKFNVGELELTVHHTPGHTEGSVVFDFGAAALFSGDLLFAGSVGRTDLPGGDPAAMSRSLAQIAAALPDEANVYPGHGASTKMGHERRTNPYLIDAERGSRQ